MVRIGLFMAWRARAARTKNPLPVPVCVDHKKQPKRFAWHNTLLLGYRQTNAWSKYLILGHLGADCIMGLICILTIVSVPHINNLWQKNMPTLSATTSTAPRSFSNHPTRQRWAGNERWQSTWQNMILEKTRTQHEWNATHIHLVTVDDCTFVLVEE